jgi:hypothetical protein
MATAAVEASTTDKNAVTGKYARKVLQYGEIIERMVKAAKQPGFTEAGWDELASLLDVAKFERVGNDRAAMGWDVYRGLLTQWATTTDFWGRFRRISEVGNLVFLELEEHNTPIGPSGGGGESVVNSCTVYEFDEADKLVHLDIYLQHT